MNHTEHKYIYGYIFSENIQGLIQINQTGFFLKFSKRDHIGSKNQNK